MRRSYRPTAYLGFGRVYFNIAASDAPLNPLAGGQWIGGAGPTEKITAVLGDPPKRFGVTEFENIDKAQAWLKSSGREAIAPKRDKAIKLVRQFIFEGK